MSRAAPGDRWRRALGFSVALTLAVGTTRCAAQEPTARQAENQRCLNCHGQPHIGTISDRDRRTMVSVPPGESLPPRTNPERLLVDPAQRASDVHRNVACTACHTGVATLPHAARLPPPSCTACHPDAADELTQSIHAEAALRPDADAPRCWDCHGTHDIRRKSDPAALTYPLNVIRTCGNCHSGHVGEPLAGHDGREWVTSYLDSVHGRAVTKAGLVVAATCADCHGHHSVRPSSDPASTAHRDRIADTCGRCHAGVRDVFETSVHAEAARGRSRFQAPVCSDCHSSHRITRADTPGFLHDIVGECGSCHAELYRTYRESYHGQVQALGSNRAAKCSDCHGAHNIRRVDDPASTLAGPHRAETCARCHTGLARLSEAARENFVKYRPHADYRDRTSHPVLYYIWLYFMVLMGVTFTFWGLHSAAWFVRGTIDRMRRGPRQVNHAGPAIQRFSAWHRWTHALVIVSFLGLTMTGLPLKFSDYPWAAALMTVIGGPERAGFAHRCFAVLVLVYLVMHAVHLWRNRRGGDRSLLARVFGPNSMLPMRKDWRQFTQMVRWFLGRGPKPSFDRWTYWEKFDYWADLVGTFIIGVSGLLLWFPAFFAGYLSGYWFNIATVVHGYEALLAAGFIFSIHFFNAHLRWEKFPVDRVIFTGQLPEAEFREERVEQFERLARQGELDALRVPPAPRWQHHLATVVGILALLIGVILIVLIVWAGLS